MTSFDEFVRKFLDDLFRLDPVLATAAGVHDHDGRWPDLSEPGRLEALSVFAQWETTFTALDETALTADQRIDRDRILAELASLRHSLTEARDETWDPLIWIYVLGSGLFGLLAREFAPVPVRVTSLTERIAGIPAVLEAASAVIGSWPARPVSRFHTERALKDLGGIRALIADAITLAGPGADAELDDVGPARVRLTSAADLARAALSGFEEHLRDRVLPRAEGEGRLGPERFATKLASTLGDPDMTLDRVLAAAERQLPAVRAEMARLARAMWPTARPAEPEPEDPDVLTRDMLDDIGRDHSAADELLQVARDALVRIEAFCRDRDVIGLAEEPLEIEWTPLFLRGWAQAMLSSPGPFEAGEKAYFHITPIPAEWSDDARDSYLREMNRHQLEVLTIHEAVPGHYLQGVYGNRVRSPLRAALGHGAYAEGWAVYVTQVMIDLGYGADDPALALAHWKYYLRAIINTIIDIRIHTSEMTEAEALDLMIRVGFQEDAEARAKYSRARLTSTQLCTYFVGSLGMWELEHEVRLRAAALDGGDSAVAMVPTPELLGGYPATPGFEYRAHLESVISHGPLPLPLLRRAILGE